LFVLQGGDAVEQGAVGFVQCGAVQRAQGSGVASELQKLALQAGALLGNALALSGQLGKGAAEDSPAVATFLRPASAPRSWASTRSR
jgi:hypothetical protein